MLGVPGEAAGEGEGRAMTKRNLRPSRLPLAQLCRGAPATEEDCAVRFALPANASSTPAELGAAFHECVALESGDQKRVVLLEDVDRIAQRFGVPKADLRWLWSRVVGRTEDLRGATRIWTERPVAIDVSDELEISGTLDRAILAGELLTVDDWKSGWIAARETVQADEHMQLLAYGIGAFMQLRREKVKIAKLRVRIIPVRLGFSPRTHVFEISELKAVYEGLRELAAEADRQRFLPLEARTYTVGEHCKLCTGRGICPAYQREMLLAVAIVKPPDVDPESVPKTRKGEPNKKAMAAAARQMVADRVRELVTQNPLRAYELKQMASRLCDGIDEALKANVALFGSLDCGDGTALELRPFRTRGGITEDSVRVAASAIGYDAEQIELLIEAIRARPQLDSERFGRYKLGGTAEEE